MESKNEVAKKKRGMEVWKLVIGICFVSHCDVYNIYYVRYLLFKITAKFGG